MKIEEIAISKIIPYARNPRRAPDGLVSKVAASIKEFGFRQPIVVDDEMVIVVGHTRLEAARQLGLTKVPVHVARDMTATQARAYRIADNRLADDAEWDVPFLELEAADLNAEAFDMSLLGFEVGELESLFKPPIDGVAVSSEEEIDSKAGAGEHTCPNCGFVF